MDSSSGNRVRKTQEYSRSGISEIIEVPERKESSSPEEVGSQ